METIKKGLVSPLCWWVMMEQYWVRALIYNHVTTNAMRQDCVQLFGDTEPNELHAKIRKSLPLDLRVNRIAQAQNPRQIA